MNGLAVGAENTQLSSEIALDEGRHIRTQIGLDTFHVGGKGTEDHAAEDLDLQGLQAVLADVEISGMPP